MTYSPLLISLPVADRARAYAFYRDALGLEATGELADDGLPEPLIFILNDRTHLMLIPSGGFGWVIGHHQVAPSGTSECTIGIEAATSAEVDALIERARSAGAGVALAPAPQPWGYSASFTDPDGHVWIVRSAEGGE